MKRKIKDTPKKHRRYAGDGKETVFPYSFVVVPGYDTTLEMAAKVVYGDRDKDYGHPLDDFTVTAKLWSAIFGFKVAPEQVPLCMIAVKISRECRAHKRDNLVDIAGYADTLQRALDEKANRLEKAIKQASEEKCPPSFRARGHGFRPNSIEGLTRKQTASKRR